MSKNKPFDVCVPEKYQTDNGEEKTKYYQVGVAFEIESGGMSVILPEGISLSGRFVIFPRKDRHEPTP
ncbi:hypothetical protein [Hoeflea sp. EC-HK425]|uniref:hypothetical protein n=1 Tax=Hoeflea sp. EC-HK425 TaxID=2038388 RepID=UPI00125B9A03|nr:hypothetical protein [Hoeflea sp. EC-HK425]VVS99829.1 conserved hypothetical protein [Hoeflea sp. EC-HK425]